MRKTRKVVVLKASETRVDSHSEFALDHLLAFLEHSAQRRGISLDLRLHHLADYLTEIPTPKQLASVSPELEPLVIDFFHNDLLVIGVPIKNFAPSILLQVFFHRMRLRLLTLDKQGELKSRNWNHHKVAIVLTGHSSRLKYWLLNQFVFYVHFNMLFDFWGRHFTNNPLRLLFRSQHKVAKAYIGDCRCSTFEARKPEIIQQMQRFSQKISCYLD